MSSTFRSENIFDALSAGAKQLGPMAPLYLGIAAVVIWLITALLSGSKERASRKDIQRELYEAIQRRKTKLLFKKFEDDGDKHTKEAMANLRKLLQDPATRDEHLKRLKPRTRLIMLKFMRGAEDISEQATHNKKGAHKYRTDNGGYKMPYDSDANSEPKPSCWSTLLRAIPYEGFITTISLVAFYNNEMTQLGADPLAPPILSHRPPVTMELDAWLWLWMIVAAKIAVALSVFRLGMLFLRIVTAPIDSVKSFLLPFTFIIAPVWSDMSKSLDVMFEHGTIEQHIGGMWRFYKSVVALVFIPVNAILLIPIVYVHMVLQFFFSSRFNVFACVVLALAILYASNITCPIDFNVERWTAPFSLVLNELKLLLETGELLTYRYLYVSLYTVLFGMFGHTLVYSLAFLSLTLFYSIILCLVSGSVLALAFYLGLGSNMLFGYLAFLFGAAFPLLVGVVLARVDVKAFTKVLFPFLGAAMVACALWFSSSASLQAVLNVPTILSNQFLGAATVPSIGCTSASSHSMAEASSAVVREFCVELLCGNVMELPARSPYESTPFIDINDYIGTCTSSAVELCRVTGEYMAPVPFLYDQDCTTAVRYWLVAVYATATFFLWRVGQDSLVKLTTATVGAFILNPAVNVQFFLLVSIFLHVQSFLAAPLTEVLLSYVE